MSEKKALDTDDFIIKRGGNVIKSNRKSQAAMEFLMTYGWAILVVLAAIAALAYFGVLSPARFLPERCVFPSGLTCIDKAVISDSANTVTFSLRNNLGSNINITSISDDPGTDDSCPAPLSLSACQGIGCTPLPVASNSVSLDNNALGVFQVSCNAISAGRFAGDIIINYANLDTGLIPPSSGEIRGEAT